MPQKLTHLSFIFCMRMCMCMTRGIIFPFIFMSSPWTPIFPFSPHFFSSWQACNSVCCLIRHSDVFVFFCCVFFFNNQECEQFSSRIILSCAFILVLEIKHDWAYCYRKLITDGVILLLVRYCSQRLPIFIYNRMTCTFLVTGNVMKRRIQVSPCYHLPYSSFKHTSFTSFPFSALHINNKRIAACHVIEELQSAKSSVLKSFLCRKTLLQLLQSTETPTKNEVL